MIRVFGAWRERVGKVDAIIVPFRGYGTWGMVRLSHKFLLFTVVCKVFWIKLGINIMLKGIVTFLQILMILMDS